MLMAELTYLLGYYIIMDTREAEPLLAGQFLLFCMLLWPDPRTLTIDQVLTGRV
jgi:hypothetical protein